MTAPGPFWRAILWVERFLPTPPQLPLDPDRSVAARRRAALVPLLVFPAIVAPALLQSRHQIGPMLLANRIVLEQLMLVVAGCVAIAAIGCGIKTWRDAGKPF